jgi:hypothetical protein
MRLQHGRRSAKVKRNAADTGQRQLGLRRIQRCYRRCGDTVRTAMTRLDRVAAGVDLHRCRTFRAAQGNRGQPGLVMPGNSPQHRSKEQDQRQQATKNRTKANHFPFLAPPPGFRHETVAQNSKRPQPRRGGAL